MDYQHVKVGKFAELGNGEKMHYHERNGGGDPVIFLHGGGQGAGGWTNWKTNLDPLAAAGYRAICTDAIGYGISSKPPEQDYNFEYLVSALERFVDSLGMDKVSFVGNSMGGAMTLRYAQRNPERRRAARARHAVLGPLERGILLLESPDFPAIPPLARAQHVDERVALRLVEHRPGRPRLFPAPHRNAPVHCEFGSR